MNRTHVIQQIIDAKNAYSYLEIGIQNGANFFRIRAPHKVAVDPAFIFMKLRTLGLSLKYNRSKSSEYHRCSSDDYFNRYKIPTFFDVIFIDGLHTFEQSLQDVLNALNRLNDDGVVILHDCNPPTVLEAHPARSWHHIAAMNLPGWSGVWCGDVWKTIVYLRALQNDLKVFVLDCDLGIGIVTKGVPDSVCHLTLPEINAMTFTDLNRDRIGLLNLKNINYLTNLIAGLQTPLSP